jgi:alpha-N-arabinofuranosidase
MIHFSRYVFAAMLSVTAPVFPAAATEFHVSPAGNDSNTATSASPLRTIQRAATLAQPGDTITVHAGIYRERVNPPRGGTSDSNRIVYRAAPGETAVITGSEPVTGWTRVSNDTWSVTLPASTFGAFNPYSDLIRGDWFDPRKRNHHTGAVYLNGEWLTEAATLDEVMKPAGKAALWFGRADSAATTLWAQFPGVDPNRETVEINVRRTVFYPDQPGRDFITVRGFTLRHAATPWAPPTAEQIGLIGTHWSKGWIIEDNRISHSVCSGVSLGKYGDEWDNRSGSAEGYVGTIHRALSNGWSRATIGSHIVRGNTISHCEQTGIVGSLGAAFSTIDNNEIHDIHVRRLFGGAEMAAIKFHGAIDVTLSRNHIHHSLMGIWLDWMAQGTRVTANLLHDNIMFDLKLEVNHGPILVDNNVLLSKFVCEDYASQSVYYAHNLITGTFRLRPDDTRSTPFHHPHSTGIAGMHDNPVGDHRFINNLLAGQADLRPYDKVTLPVSFDGNVFLGAARPALAEKDAIHIPEADPDLRLVTTPDGIRLEMRLAPDWLQSGGRSPVTTERLGLSAVSKVPFQNPDCSPLTLDTDYHGMPRDAARPVPGPFANPRFPALLSRPPAVSGASGGK